MRGKAGGKAVVMDLTVEALLERGLRGLILDMATGSGSFIGFLRYHAAPGAVVVAADPDCGALRSVSGAFPDQDVLPVAATGERLCFPDACFDAVALSNAVHHFRDPWPVLSEMMRGLKPGGLFVLREMFSDGPQTGPQLTHVLVHHWRAEIDSAHGVYHGATLPRARLEAIPGALGLTGVLSSVRTDMEADPKAPDTVRTVEKTIESSIARAEGWPRLQARGEELLKRLHEVGFAGASSVLAAGFKA